MLSFSVVINTLNRGNLLQKTLESFRWLKYEGDFEVVVVNGPSTDNSDEIISSWLPHIRVGKCNAANISVSRNIGICMARGDIVAFIDDDAIPEPEWLTQLAAAYDRDEIGGAGGVVYDQSGRTCQFEYSTADRLGNVNWAAGGSAEHLCFPGSFEFPYLQGTNASFRRSALLEIGGFDEEFEYYLDETEVCCRLVDAGYIIRQLDNAFVHHKIAPSHLRDERKITRCRYPSLKNKLYFSLKHAQPSFSIPEILKDGEKFRETSADDMEYHIAEGRIPASERDRFSKDAKLAWEHGLERGLSDFRELINPAKLEKYRGSFQSFSAAAGSSSKSIVLVFRDFPSDQSRHDAAFNRNLAEPLASEGNIVHVITQCSDINRVDFENGVWVHRILPRKIELSPEAAKRRIPPQIWNWSAAALNEARRIAAHRTIDVIEAPIWENQGAAFLFDGRWPLVSILQNTLHSQLNSGRESRKDDHWIQSFAIPMLAMEKELMARSDAVRAVSSVINRDIKNSSCFALDKDRLFVESPVSEQVAGKSSELYRLAGENFGRRQD